MRDLSQQIQNTIAGSSVTAFLAVDLYLDSGTVSVWNGYGTLTYNAIQYGVVNYNGVQYTGVGSLIGIGQVEETSELSARGATVSLSGIPSTMLSLALQEKYQGRKATISFGVFVGGQASGWAINNSVWTDSGAWSDAQYWNDYSVSIMNLFNGYIDQMNISESSGNCTITVTIESKLIDLERPREFRFNSASQKSLYPGDLGLDFVESLQGKQFNWGRS